MIPGFRGFLRFRLAEFFHLWNANKAFAGMVLSSFFLSVASWMTTFGGLRHFNLDLLSSLFISFGVQTFMAIVAFQLGGLIANSIVDADGVEEKRSVLRPLLIGSAGAGLCYSGYLAAIGDLDGLRLLGASLLALSVISMASFGKHAYIFFCYLTAMAISVIFSFDSIFNALSPPDKRQREAMIIAESDVNDTAKRLEKALASQTDDMRAPLQTGPFWQGFESAIKSVVSAANLNREAIETKEQARLRDLERKTIDAAEGRKEIELKLNRARADVEGAKRELPELLKDSRTLAVEVEKLTAAFNEAHERWRVRNDQINAEIRGDTGRGGSCGQMCNYWKSGDPAIAPDSRRKELSRIVTFQSLIEQRELARIALDGPKKRLATLAGRLKVLEGAEKDGDSVVRQHAVDVAVADRRIEEIGRVNLESGSDKKRTLSASGLTAAMGEYHKKPDRQSLAILVGSCNQVVNDLRSYDKPGQERRCGDDYQTLAIGYFDFLDDKAKFEQDCSEKSRRTAGQLERESQAVSRENLKPEDQRRIFSQLVQKGRECINLARLKDDQVLRDARARIDDLELSISPDAKNPLAQNAAAFKRYDVTAFFAAIIALAMDSFILFCGIFGSKAAANEHVRAVLSSNFTPDEDDDDEVRNAKIFLAHIKPMTPPADGFGATIDLDQIPNEQDRRIINLIISGRASSFSHLGGNNKSTVFRVRDGFIRQLCLSIYRRRRKSHLRSGHDPEFPPTSGKRRFWERFTSAGARGFGRDEPHNLNEPNSSPDEAGQRPSARPREETVPPTQPPGVKPLKNGNRKG